MSTMTTGSPSDPGRNRSGFQSTGIGRVRGLRQGGRPSMVNRFKKSTKKSKPPLGHKDRFNNIVSQLSSRPSGPQSQSFIRRKKG